MEEMQLSDSLNWRIDDFNKIVPSLGLVKNFKSWSGQVASEWKFSIEYYLGSAILKVEAYDVELFSGKHKTSVEFHVTERNYSNTVVGMHKMTSLPGEAVELAKFSIPLGPPYMEKGHRGEFHIRIELTLRRQVPKKIEKRMSLAEFTATAKINVAEEIIQYANQADPCHTVKIISMEGEEFEASRLVLAARSPVLEAMMKPTMKEGITGIVRFPEISSGILKVLLHFITKGELLPEWRSKDVIVGLAVAAHSYNLKDLLSFLDQNVGQHCNVETAGELLRLARKCGMPTAEKDTLWFIKENVGNSFEDLEKILVGLNINVSPN